MLSGIYDLRNGTITSLMLSTEKNADRVMAAVTDEIRIGELTINAKSRKVARLGEEISLTPKEFDLLVFLASNKGIALSRAKILQKVWN